MGKKLFVGGLAWATTDDTLRRAFEKFGALASANVILDRETGRSRGFGFVVYTTDEDAARALEALQGADLDGRRLRLDMATDGPGPRREGPSRYPPVERRGPGGDSGPPRGDYGPPRGDSGPPRGGYGPPRGDSGPPRGGYGPPRGDYGPPRGYAPPPEPLARWEGGEGGDTPVEKERVRRTEKHRRDFGRTESEKDWPSESKRGQKYDPRDLGDDDE